MGGPGGGGSAGHSLGLDQPSCSLNGSSMHNVPLSQSGLQEGATKAAYDRSVDVRIRALLQEVALQRTAWDQISRHIPHLLSLQRLRKLLLSDNGLHTLPQVLPQRAQ